MMRTSLIRFQPSAVLFISFLFWSCSAEFADADGIKPKNSDQATEQRNRFSICSVSKFPGRAE